MVVVGVVCACVREFPNANVLVDQMVETEYSVERVMVLRELKLMIS